MTFVWKTTCRRLQSSGALARFAEGAVSEQERVEIETHLKRCPACEATVADTLAVASLLKANTPAVPSRSLAASGNLWATLESEIARTPQDAPLTKSDSVPSSTHSPSQLQRFGQWLATPGALPFGSAAAAAVVFMVGIVVYHRFGGNPMDVKTVASVSPGKDSEFTEIHIIPSPKAIVAAPASKKAEPVRARAVPLSVASADNELKIDPIKSKATSRRSITSVVTPHRSLPVSPAAPSKPREPFQMVKANGSDYAMARAETFAAPVAPAPAGQALELTQDAAPPSSAMANMAKAGGQGGGSQGQFGGMGGGVHDKSKPEERVANGAVASTDSATMARIARPSAAIPPPAPIVPPSPMAAAPRARMSTFKMAHDNSEDKINESSEVQSLLDRALQQQRQRSLFSYATR